MFKAPLSYDIKKNSEATQFMKAIAPPLIRTLLLVGLLFTNANKFHILSSSTAVQEEF